MKTNSKFFRVFCLLFGIIVTSQIYILAINVLLGEMTSISEIVRRQQDNIYSGKTCLMSSHRGYSSFTYKTEMVKRVKPDVIILGSSRVMLFRPHIFLGPTVNAGGAARSIADVISFIQEIGSYSSPKMIIIGIDWWWFNEKWESSAMPMDLTSRNRHYDYRGKLGEDVDRQIKLAALPFRSLSKFSSCHFGAPGKFRHEGFGPFGSLYYGGIWSGQKRNPDRKFRDTLAKFGDETSRLATSDGLSLGHMARLKYLEEYLSTLGINYFLVLPPIAPKIYESMREKYSDYRYVWELERYIEGLNYGFNFHNRLIDATDCEFVDGLHGGDVLYARILQKLGERSNAVKNVIDVDVMSQYLKRKNTDHFDYGGVFNFKSRDHLGFNCYSTGVKFRYEQWKKAG